MTATAKNFWNLNQGILKGKYHCTADLLFDWFGISCMTTDNFCFYLQNRQILTGQTGGQQYSDTFPFSIPCLNSWNQQRDSEKPEFFSSFSERLELFHWPVDAGIHLWQDVLDVLHSVDLSKRALEEKKIIFANFFCQGSILLRNRAPSLTRWHHQSQV